MMKLLLMIGLGSCKGFAVAPPMRLSAVALAKISVAPAPKMSLTLPIEYNGCAAVMAGWVFLYYSNMWIAAGAPKDCCPGQATWGNRLFLNMGEQAPAFLVSFWTHAIFASPIVATQCGTAYLGFTVLYALLRLKCKGGVDNTVSFASTVPRYAINLFLVISAVAQRSFGLGLGKSAFHAVAFMPFAVTFFLIFTKAGEVLQKTVFASAN